MQLVQHPARVARGLAVLAVSLLALVVGASAANAAQSPPGGGSSGGGGFGSAPSTTCSAEVWKTPPRIVLHTSEYLADGGKSSDIPSLTTAVSDVVGQFNAMGGTSAKIASVSTSSAPFRFGQWFNDSTPTIHVGFASDNNSAGVTTPVHLGDDRCLKEMHIAFADQADPASPITWDFSTPMDTYWENTYYQASTWDARGHTWFRPLFLHELLHAFAFEHTSTDFSFMDYPHQDGFPWANRAGPEAIRPLPFEVGRLRTLYPPTGTPPFPTRYDVAVLNNWFGAPLSNDAASQLKLCTPSVGTEFSDELTAGPCGTSDERTACPGDTVLTRYTLANYSSGSVHVTAKLYFATEPDANWATSEIHSADAQVFDVVAASSSLQKAEWIVPNLTHGVSYHPIIHVDAVHLDSHGVADTSTERSDWMPLRTAGITGGSCAASR